MILAMLAMLKPFDFQTLKLGQSISILGLWHGLPVLLPLILAAFSQLTFFHVRGSVHILRTRRTSSRKTHFPCFLCRPSSLKQIRCLPFYFQTFYLLKIFDEIAAESVERLTMMPSYFS